MRTPTHIITVRPYAIGYSGIYLNIVKILDPVGLNMLY